MIQPQAAQFEKFPAYADAIRSADPKAIVILAMEKREDIQRFHLPVVCPGVSRSAFEHCYYFLAMDGTFARFSASQFSVSVDAGCLGFC